MGTVFGSRGTATWLALALAATACTGGLRNPTPAKRGAGAIVGALAGDDPAAAYALLSKDARARVSFEEFRLQWQASAAERAWQVARLREALAADPDAGERATITFADGKAVSLVRDQARWRLAAPLVSRTHAARPREAVRMFAEAIRDHDLNAFLRSLTRRRREGLMRQLDGFLAGLERKVEGTIEEIGTDRAELRWDEAGMRYRIVIRKEDDEWLIDDIHIQPAPEDEAPATPTDDQPPPDIF